MKKINIIYVFISILLSFVGGFIYAAGGANITSLVEPISQIDIIHEDYYSNLNGPKAEGKLCKYIGGRLTCIDDPPTPIASNFCILDAKLNCIFK